MSMASEMFGRKLKNPLVLASGILGVTKASLETVCANGCGAVTTKTLTLEPRKGHEGPNIVETEAGLLNAMGYPNPGIDDGIREFTGWKRKEALIISITGKDANEFALLAEKIENENKKQKLGACAVEAAISCPHTPGFGTMAGQGTPESVSEITKKITEKTKLPLIIKLSPSVTGQGEAAGAAEKAGAAAINMGNSLGPGMKIDLKRKRAILGFGVGGLSGPAIKPVAVRCVYDVYKSVKIPIIGTGGVTTGEDAFEMMMAGARWVGVGTAVYYRGPKVFGEIAGEMENWMGENGYGRLDEIIGVAHEVRNHKTAEC